MSTPSPLRKSGRTLKGGPYDIDIVKCSKYPMIYHGYWTDKTGVTNKFYYISPTGRHLKGPYKTKAAACNKREQMKHKGEI